MDKTTIIFRYDRDIRPYIKVPNGFKPDEVFESIHKNVFGDYYYTLSIYGNSVSKFIKLLDSWLTVKNNTYHHISKINIIQKLPNNLELIYKNDEPIIEIEV